MILPVRMFLGFGLCLFSMRADIMVGIMAGASCFPSDEAVFNANGCDLTFPGTPSPGSAHAFFSYQAPETSGFSITASALTLASVTTQFVSSAPLATSHVGIVFLYDTLGPVR